MFSRGSNVNIGNFFHYSPSSHNNTRRFARFETICTVLKNLKITGGGKIISKLVIYLLNNQKLMLLKK